MKHSTKNKTKNNKISGPNVDQIDMGVIVFCHLTLLS